MTMPQMIVTETILSPTDLVAIWQSTTVAGIEIGNILSYVDYVDRKIARDAYHDYQTMRAEAFISGQEVKRRRRERAS